LEPNWSTQIHTGVCSFVDGSTVESRILSFLLPPVLLQLQSVN
jgi:hypothetical protein